MTNLLDEEEVEADDDDVLGTSPSVSNCLLCCGSFVAVLPSHSWSLLAKKKSTLSPTNCSLRAIQFFTGKDLLSTIIIR